MRSRQNAHFQSAIVSPPKVHRLQPDWTESALVVFAIPRYVGPVAGEEFLYVLEGEVIIHSNLYAPTELKRGDSLYFDGTQGHAYICGSDDPARILVLVARNQQVDNP